MRHHFWLMLLFFTSKGHFSKQYSYHRNPVFQLMKCGYHFSHSFCFSCFCNVIFLSILLEQRKFTLHSPDASSGIYSNGITNPCIRSPYIDGCSPIKNWSPMRLEVCRGRIPYRTSLIRIPFAVETHSEDEEEKEKVPSPDVSSPVSNAVGGPLRQLISDASTPSPHLVVTATSVTQRPPGTSGKQLALQDVGSEKNDTVDMVDTLEIADENTWSKEPADDGSLPVPDFVSGIGFSIENSQMCISPLAESSVLPCENSNMQVRCVKSLLAFMSFMYVLPIFLRLYCKVDNGYVSMRTLAFLHLKKI